MDYFIQGVRNVKSKSMDASEHEHTYL